MKVGPTPLCTPCPLFVSQVFTLGDLLHRVTVPCILCQMSAAPLPLPPCSFLHGFHLFCCAFSFMSVSSTCFSTSSFHPRPREPSSLHPQPALLPLPAALLENSLRSRFRLARLPRAPRHCPFQGTLCASHSYIRGILSPPFSLTCGNIWAHDSFSDLNICDSEHLALQVPTGFPGISDSSRTHFLFAPVRRPPPPPLSRAKVPLPHTLPGKGCYALLRLQ